MLFARNLIARGCACVFFMAAIAAAAPITFTLTGTGSGTLGGKFFNNAAFTFTLTADTNTLMPPTCCPGDIDT
ncbi:MAG TPA: hypothetical protein VFW44_03675, partial [Bryobacteraceae bacterium]|nr:hypothetical protein [Bryobacteraceae bacterium]